MYPDLLNVRGVFCRLRANGQIVYDQEVDTLNQAHEEQREEEKQNSEQKMNEVQVTKCGPREKHFCSSGNNSLSSSLCVFGVRFSWCNVIDCCS